MDCKYQRLLITRWQEFKGYTRLRVYPFSSLVARFGVGRVVFIMAPDPVEAPPKPVLESRGQVFMVLVVVMSIERKRLKNCQEPFRA